MEEPEPASEVGVFGGSKVLISWLMCTAWKEGTELRSRETSTKQNCVIPHILKRRIVKDVRGCCTIAMLHQPFLDQDP